MMPGRKRLLMRIFLATIFALLGESLAKASERAWTLVNSFQVMCTIEPLDFARSEERATAMRLPVRQELKTPPNPNGYFARSKSWLLPLKTGPHEFAVSEAHGPKGDVKSCGIGAGDVTIEDFRSELTKAMKLGRPTKETLSPDGAQRLTLWLWGPDRNKLILADGSPKGQSGIILTLMQAP
jgi:hypothetical protein